MAMLQIKLVEEVVVEYHSIHTCVPHKREAVTLGVHNDSNLWWEILSLTGYVDILDMLILHPMVVKIHKEFALCFSTRHL